MNVGKDGYFNFSQFFSKVCNIQSFLFQRNPLQLFKRDHVLKMVILQLQKEQRYIHF